MKEEENNQDVSTTSGCEESNRMDTPVSTPKNSLEDLSDFAYKDNNKIDNKDSTYQKCAANNNCPVTSGEVSKEKGKDGKLHENVATRLECGGLKKVNTLVWEPNNYEWFSE